VLDFTARIVTSCLVGWWRLDFDKPALMKQNAHAAGEGKDHPKPTVREDAGDLPDGPPRRD
jgi:hypothetical protein